MILALSGGTGGAKLIEGLAAELDPHELTIVCTQAGNVNSGSFDPFEEICDRAARARAWVHVDGAFSLWAAGPGPAAPPPRRPAAPPRVGPRRPG